MKSALAKLAGYVPPSDNVDYLKKEWDIHGRRILYGTLLIGSLIYVHFPFSDAVAGATLAYTLRGLSKMTFARYQGVKLGYDIGENPIKVLSKQTV